MTEEEWRDRFDHISSKLEDLEDRIRELEITLHGKRAKTGLLAEYERHDQLLARMYAVIWQDPTGQKGVLHDVDILMERRKDRIQGAQYKWQFWGLILATLISSAAALLVSWDKILQAFPKDHPNALEKKIERARHPKSPKKIYRVRIISPASTTGQETQADPPAPTSPPK